MATVLDHYTTSFNWPSFNFAAIWLRPQWYLVINSAITDVQGGGLTFVTGGGYTDSDEIPGHWGLAYKTVFVGETQPDNSYAFSGGPFNPTTASRRRASSILPASCRRMALSPASASIRTRESASRPAISAAISASSTSTTALLRRLKRLSGYQEDYGSGLQGRRRRLYDQPMVQRRGSLELRGITRSAGTDNCYLPNAAIAWKQPNGFYYPPAFHSDNLFFDNVDIRHYVISPLFLPGTFSTDPNKVKDHYCQQTPNMFDNWTDVDRQTELNDDDGSLQASRIRSRSTGSFLYRSGRGRVECESGPYMEPLASPLPPGTVKTSPYDYVTTAIYPKCMARDPGGEVCKSHYSQPPHDQLAGRRAPTPVLLWRSDLSAVSDQQEKNGPPMPVRSRHLASV